MYKRQEFLQLYPGANILVATKKDFEPANRKKFCARIAMGNYCLLYTSLMNERGVSVEQIQADAMRADKNRGVQPVSYTHLDVYKRQHLYRSEGWNAESATDTERFYYKTD